MQLIHGAKGISKIILILLLIVALIVGALVSYIWTLGYYGPWEKTIPNKSNIAIENISFNPADATFFNVTVLNPSYSPSNVIIKQFLISTVSETLIAATASIPSLPYDLSPSDSQTFKVNLSWGNATGQIVDIIVLVSDGSGATLQAQAPAFGNLTIASVDFYPESNTNSLNLTVQSAPSTLPVDINSMKVNGVAVAPVAPSLPYRLETGSSITFKLEYDWINLQNKTVSVELGTLQGYSVYKTVTAPYMVLSITGLHFNATDPILFNLTVQNGIGSAAAANITKITVYPPAGSFNITIVFPTLPRLLQPGSDISFECTWDWRQFQGQNFVVTVTVQTAQGFSANKQVTLP